MSGMPYVKDIGQTPRYMFATSSRLFSHRKCEHVAKCLRTLGVPFVRQNVKSECSITYGDSFDAYVDSIDSNNVSFFGYQWITL